jgi:hypothetical protein
MAGTIRVPVVAIPFENNQGATVLCDDGSVWEILYSADGGIAWNELKNPLPGSAAAQGWTPEKAARAAKSPA